MANLGHVLMSTAKLIASRLRRVIIWQFEQRAHEKPNPTIGLRTAVLVVFIYDARRRNFL